ncbi:MAG: Nicotine blue oxidoreductase [Alphaproteobacteria bacterium MarineAlpha9_Bin3]|nr:MAG: Nicotine blue oxidoreductase [Alphaproteobacteria bacterium MarineAlpha9_Bin3]|tara:strand:- start:1693 stop:3288 length:1596 start_codon:yes stop_codon:yes gene_type:complete
MYFGDIKVKDSLNCILAHTIKINNKTIKKGTVISKNVQNYFIENKIKTIVGAKLDKNDIHEDEAANKIANLFKNTSIAIEKAYTGRANILASRSGLLIINKDIINKFNMIHDDVTIATLNNNSTVKKGEMIATIKIISFSVKSFFIIKIQKLLCNKVFNIKPYNHKKCALILTHYKKENLKLNSISIQRIEDRLSNLNSSLNHVSTCEHEATNISKLINNSLKKKLDLIMILGSSAIVDIRDKIPEAILLSKGKIIKFGMPVDPGNLLLIGKINQTYIIGLPGCARSSSLNGFDWVLEKIISETHIKKQDISNMGVGGLLKTLSLRAKVKHEPKNYNISSIILAAGQSNRMQNINKLLIKIKNKSMIQKIIESSLESMINNTVVVLGHDSENLLKLLNNKNITTIINKEYKNGQSSSLQAGISALPEDCDAAIILLADMPDITPSIINQLIVNYNPSENKSIIIPTYKNKRGNPVLIDREFFPDILLINGDKGAKDIIKANKKYIKEIPQKESFVLKDIDTKEDLANYKNK